MANEYHLIDEKDRVRFELGKWHNTWGQFKGKKTQEEILAFILEVVKPEYEEGVADAWFEKLSKDLYDFIQTYHDCKNLEEQEMWKIEEQGGFEFLQINTIYRG